MVQLIVMPLIGAGLIAGVIALFIMIVLPRLVEMNLNWDWAYPVGNFILGFPNIQKGDGFEFFLVIGIMIGITWILYCAVRALFMWRSGVRHSRVFEFLDMLVRGIWIIPLMFFTFRHLYYLLRWLLP